jgi:uncharacterized protein (TIGR02117 family)
LRLTGALAAALALAIVAYLAAGLVGGAIPRNAGWRAAAAGPGTVTIWIESNGIHTGLVLPKVAAGVDWRDLAPAGDLADPRYARLDHLAIGWGERAFFLDTPDWAHVRLPVLLAAAAGSDATLLHVEHVSAPTRPADDERPVVLRADEYRRLAAFVRASVAPGGRHYRGYDRHDAFLDARGHYSAGRTCNAWTGDAMAAAGVRVGWWTPFAATVMAWF